MSRAGDPDPEGKRVKVVKQALIENPHIEAVFWDVRAQTPEPSQHPPTTPLLSFLMGTLLPLRCSQLALLTPLTPHGSTLRCTSTARTG